VVKEGWQGAGRDAGGWRGAGWAERMKGCEGVEAGWVVKTLIGRYRNVTIVNKSVPQDYSAGKRLI
jgi:hypothetical protein